MGQDSTGNRAARALAQCMATESRKGKAFGLRHSELLTKCAALLVAIAAATPSVSASQLASNVVAAIRAALVTFDPALQSFFAANRRRLLCSVQRLAQTLHSQRNLTRSALSGGTEQYQTAGTRLVWGSLSEWLDAHRVLHNRPPSAAKHSAQRAHLEALPDALVLRAGDVDLDSLERRLVRGNSRPPRGSRAKHPAYVRLREAIDRARGTTSQPKRKRTSVTDGHG